MTLGTIASFDDGYYHQGDAVKHSWLIYSAPTDLDSMVLENEFETQGEHPTREEVEDALGYLPPGRYKIFSAEHFHVFDVKAVKALVEQVVRKGEPLDARENRFGEVVKDV